MARLFSTRQLFLRYPALDKLRMDFLGWVCHYGSSFFGNSYRWFTLISPEAKRLLEDEKRQVLIALYHGRMVGTLDLRPRDRMTILISESRDGEMIARGCLGMGFSVARGSPAKGAVKGARAMLSAADEGNNLVFMVDGPRGPLWSIKPSLLRLAAVSGLPIVPWVTAGRSQIGLATWDFFLAPLWSTPMLSILGDPLQVPPEASDDELELLRLQLEERMNRMRQSADGVWALVD